MDAETQRQLKSEFLRDLRKGNAPSVRVFLKEHPELLQTEEGGQTLLHIAMLAGDYQSRSRETIALLLNRGMDINTPNEKGETILHLGVQSDNYDVKGKVEDLLNFGAHPMARDKMGRTPLHAAAMAGKQEVVEMLVKRGADINAADEQGVTPLHLAAARGEDGIIRYLAVNGANIQAKTKDGRHVWDFAIEAGKDYQAQLLKAEARRQKEQAAQRQRDAEKQADPWSLLGPDRVARVEVEKTLGYKLTEVFNFSARTYTQISHNLATKTEAVAVKSFDEFGDKTFIENAHKALQRLGGTAPETLITGPFVEKPRRNLKLPGTPN